MKILNKNNSLVKLLHVLKYYICKVRKNRTLELKILKRNNNGQNYCKRNKHKRTTEKRKLNWKMETNGNHFYRKNIL